jgi:O-antigen ligase
MAAGRLGKTALAAGAVAAQAAAGGVAATNPSMAAAGAVGAITALLLVVAPALALVAALPSSLGYWRVGPASFSLSFADVALAAAFVAALPYVPWSDPRLRRFGRLLLVYLGVLAVAVVAVASRRSVLEWGHRAFLVGCALAVGAAIQSRGLTRSALRAYVLMAVVVAVAAVIDPLGRDGVDGLPAPAYPFGMQKNPAGLLIAFGVLVLVMSPRIVALSRPVRAVALVVLFTGIVACQSRGTALALVVVLAIWLVRSGRLVRSPLVLIGIALLIGMTYVSFNALFSSDEGDSRSNSVNSRLETYDAALDLWRDNQAVGAGLKYWRDPTLAARTDGALGEPHNLVVAALGESGVVGLAALAVLVVSALLMLAGKEELVLLAGSALLAKTIASTFDIFWVAGTMTVPWIFVGMACVRDALDSTSDGAPEGSQIVRAS